LRAFIDCGGFAPHNGYRLRHDLRRPNKPANLATHDGLDGIGG
jgi:hypothetical protein